MVAGRLEATITTVFTGIIQDVGRIAAIRREGDQAHMRIETGLDMADWRAGDSVAVDGCCLTLTTMDAAVFEVVLSPETLARTVFGDARIGRRVNLEPALRLGDALGGHLLSGHVDGVGTVADSSETGEHRRLDFNLPPELAPYVAWKGSVAVNGVSLTVNAVRRDGFEVNLIPHTLAHTNLGDLRRGDRVNIETDLLARYVERLLQFRNVGTEAGEQ